MSFDIPMILLNQIIKILALPNGYLFLIGFIGIKRGQSGGISTTFIDSDHLGVAMITNGLAKKAQRNGGVPPGRQQEVDGLTCSIYRAVQIFPLALDFDVGFVHAPPPTHGALMPTKRLIQQRHQTDNPAVKRRMVNNNAALGHHFFEIAQAEGISQIPANALSNNINRVMQAFESFTYRRHEQAT